MKLLPMPKKLDVKPGFLDSKKLYIQNNCADSRIEKALSCFCCAEGGIKFEISCKCGSGEGYTLEISENQIALCGESAAGVFYGIQTLKQLFEAENVPCLYIEDTPDMLHRSFYHDVTRGKVPTVETLKKLIDTLAYYKMNSLQLYVEHTFAFKELGNLPNELGCLTADEIRELDDYCFENFIEFIPSIATFGHLYELLEREEYRHLQCLENYTENKIFWRQRMNHHTIDPTNPESIEVIKSMIDQYIPLFRTDKFNICCDETFDLANGKLKDLDTGKLYVEFVGKIIDHLKKRGKKVMMWGDILFQHPETVKELPKDTIFLSWDYSAESTEEKFKTFSDLGCTQYVCPGTSTWSRFCESISISRENIINTLDYGYKYGATGMINTNWGDYANPCTLELSMYGTVLGAAKAWNKDTRADKVFDESIGSLVYKNADAVGWLEAVDDAHEIRNAWIWNCLVEAYSDLIHTEKVNPELPTCDEITAAISKSTAIVAELKEQKWEKDIYRNEIIIAAEAVIVMCQLFAKLSRFDIDEVVSVPEWLEKFKSSWLKSNKPSELEKIVSMIEYLNNL